MDEQKVKVVIEIDKACVQSALYLMGDKLTDELWNKLTSKDVYLNTHVLEKNEPNIRLGLACLATAKVLQEEK